MKWEQEPPKSDESTDLKGSVVIEDEEKNIND